ncbi:MAG: ELWxxDGT repeat protein [Fulvivirga sp.]
MKISLPLFALLLVLTSSGFAQTFLGRFTEISEIQNVNDKIFFVADDGLNGEELWVTDGTKRNTYLLKDINPGFHGANISNLTSYNGEVFFSAYDNINGSELWKSDGTAEGTRILKDIKPNKNYNNGSNPREFTVFDNQIYFIASDDGNSSDLWKTDGTHEGTIKVLETNYIGITDIQPAGDFLFMRGSPKALWKLNSSTDEITNLSVDEYYFLDEINSFGNSIICITHTTYRQEIRLYIIDPETDEAILLKEFKEPLYGDQDIDNFTTVNEEFYFSVRTDYDSEPETDVLWKTDGTAEGTVAIKSFSWDRHWSNSYMQNFISFQNELFFRGSSGVGNYLYKSNGTEAGTLLVKEVEVDDYVEPIISNEKLYFADEGRSLWESDGTTTGTFEKYAFIELETYTDPTVFQDANKTIYFKGSDNHGLALWSNSPNTKLKVISGYSSIENNYDLRLDSKIDSLSTHSFKIENQGDKELSISKISVTGNSFGLQGEIEYLIDSGESITFDLLHFPYSEGQSKDILEINSNDLLAPTFRVNLLSNVKDTAILSKSDSIILLNELISNDDYDTSKLVLDNDKIIENQEPYHVVGSLSIEGQNDILYSLINGTGDRDNHLFDIQDSVLLALESFDYESNNLLNVRIQGTSNSTNKIFERPFFIKIQNQNEDQNFNECVQSIKNLSYALNDVEYLDENTVIAVGESGVILISENEGQSWKQVNSGTQINLKHVQFINNQVGFIIGSNGVLLKTENKGKDWFHLEPPSLEYPYPENLYFLDDQTGFVFGENGDIYKTINGGLSWNHFRKGFEYLTSAYFINDQTGFICGYSNTLLKTVNGGKTWNYIDLNDLGWGIRFMDIQLIDENIGYMAGSSGSIFKTTDTGETWTQVGSFSTNSATDIYFQNEQIGFAIGGGSGSDIYKTEDGGATWIAQRFSNYYQTVLAFDFTENLSKGCAVGLGSSWGGANESGRTILLKDNSDTWESTSLLKAVDYNAVNFQDSIGLIFSENGVFRSEDAGLTWNQTLSNKSFYKDHFINDSLGYVISDSLYKTSNYGLTWSNQGKIESFRDFYFVNESIGYAIDFWGGFYKTTDEGNSWQFSDVGKTGLLSIYFLSESEGYILGSGGILLHTNDAGLSWAEVDITTKSLWAMNFHDQIGFIGGADGVLFKTTDRGLSWNEVSNGILLDIRNIDFKSSSEVYIAATNIGSIGGSTTAYKSNDTGNTWKATLHTDAIYDMQVTNEAVYLVGEEGKFLSITDDSRPTLPGPIAGPSVASINLSANYTVPNSNNTYYKWEVEGENEIFYDNDESVLTWNEIGTHSLTVTPYNSCGEGLPRNLLVAVEEYPAPSIIGSDSVSTHTQETYTSEPESNNRLSWKLTGASNYHNLNDSSISVEWSNIDKGQILLMETNIYSGARGYDALDVYIIHEEITLGVVADLFPEFRVYPNPTSDYLNFDLSDFKNENIKIRILDTSGRLVRRLDFNDSNQSINIENLKSGIYILQLVTSDLSSTKRIIKK